MTTFEVKQMNIKIVPKLKLILKQKGPEILSHDETSKFLCKFLKKERAKIYMLKRRISAVDGKLGPPVPHDDPLDCLRPLQHRGRQGK